MKKIGRLLAILMLAVTVLCGQAVQASAAVAPVTAEIPFKVTLTGTKPSPAETYVIVLKAGDDACPMPDGASGKEYTKEIKGAGEGSFQISYAHPGVYTYTVFQKAGTNKSCTYDSCVYAVTVFVTNSESTPGTLEIAVKAEKQNVEGTKCPIEFKNAYPKAESSGSGTSPKTGDESNLPLSFLMVGGGVLLLAVLFVTRKKKESGSEE